MNNRKIDEPKPNQVVDRDWSTLPADILGLISGHLVMEEKVFRGVCKSWRSAPTYSPTNYSYSDPWLLYMRRNQNRCRAVSPFGSRSLDMELPSQLAGYEIRCCKDGWLLFELDRLNFILFNPLTREIFDRIPKAPRLFSNIWFKPPTSAGEVCTIVGFRAYALPVDIGTWKFGEEKWSVYSLLLEKPDHELSGGWRMVRVGNKFYVMGPDGGIGVFDPDDVLSSFCHWNISVPMHNSGRSDSDDVNFATPYSPSYLVEASGGGGQLWGVFETIPDRTIRIFSLDLEKQQWEETHHLGDHTLFLSNGRCFSKLLLPITKLRNKIFFPKSADDMSYMLYCPLTNKFSSLNGQLSTSTALDLKNFHFASWFTN